MIASLTLGVIDNAMVLMAVQYKNQLMIRGAVFILAIIYNNFMIVRRDMYLTRFPGGEERNRCSENTGSAPSARSTS